jgi:hypothetical protein
MNSWLAPTRWLIFLALWRMSYETANVNSSNAPVKSYLVQRNPPEEADNPIQREWAKKAVSQYAAAQEKKWQRWNEAMFERSD